MALPSSYSAVFVFLGGAETDATVPIISDGCTNILSSRNRRTSRLVS